MINIGIWATSALLILTSACSPEIQSGESIYFVLPWSESGETAQVREVEVSTIKSLTAVSGDAAQIAVGLSSVNESLIQMEFPVARFVDIGSNRFIPSDVVSLQLATIYAHMERLMKLDSQMGSRKFVQYPRNVAMDANVIDPEKRESIKNNAFYLSDGDVTFFVPYDRDGLPTTLNGGIIAHEHFHGIFHHAVIDP